MNIEYCCLVSKADIILLTEYPPNSSNNWMRIKNLLNKIYSGNSSGQIFIENNLAVNYIRTIYIIFICISNKKSTNENEQMFLKKIINTLKNDNESLDKILDNITVTKLCLQEKMVGVLHNLFINFAQELEIKNGGDYLIEKNIDSTNENINEPLVDKTNTTQINNNHTVIETYKSPSSYKKICLIIFVSILIILLVSAYFIIAYIKCGSIKIICS